MRARALCLAEKPDGHFLLDVCPLEDFGELFEGDEVVLVLVGLHDGPLGDGDQLLLADVGANHHGQHGQQLLLGDLVVTVQIVHPECKSEFFFPGVHLVLVGVFLDGSEVSQNVDEIAKVDDFLDAVFVLTRATWRRHPVLLLGVAAIGRRVPEKCVHDPIAQGVDGQLGDAKEILASQKSLLLLVQAGETTVQPLDLI